MTAHDQTMLALAVLAVFIAAIVGVAVGYWLRGRP